LCKRDRVLVMVFHRRGESGPSIAAR
jgi:hypothetical protein